MDNVEKIPKQTAKESGVQTKARILQAAWDTVYTDGIIGVSARSVARTGELNQALIFYHFGSIHELLIALMESESKRRVQIYTEQLAKVTTLPELVEVARQLHEQESQSGATKVLTQLCSAAGGSDDLRVAMSKAMHPWHEVISQVIHKLLGESALVSVISPSDAAWAIGALFMGLELFASVDTTFSDENNLFTSFENLATLLQNFL